MTIREIRTFNSKIRKLERLSEQYLNSKIKIEIENKRLKQKLKNTRKALEIAVDTLKIIGSGKVIEHSVMFHEDDNKISIANKALDEITALEQKDVK